MTESNRMPSWRERENNKRRERRRRAIAAKIYSGLRMYGNFELPKHCDNNEVLKALCKEAGWVVEEDGTTYRKGCKPAVDQMDIVGGSASMSVCSSYQNSPQASYNPSPSASSFPSPAHYMAAFANNLATSANPDPNSLIPWLKNLSSNATTTTNSSCHTPTFPYYIAGGSISAPVTPPLSSPTCTTPRARNEWGDPSVGPIWPGVAQSYSLSSSTPQSPGRQVLPEPAWLANIQQGGTQTSPTSPTFSLVAPNPFGCKENGGGSRMWTPGQSGTCSPAVPAGSDGTADVPMAGPASEFAFGSCSANGMVNAWEGERIHEECVPEPDDLELTLGGSKTR